MCEQRVLAAAKLDREQAVCHDARAGVDLEFAVLEGTGARKPARTWGVQPRASLRCTATHAQLPVQHRGVADDPYIVAVHERGQGQGLRDFSGCIGIVSFATPPAVSAARGHLGCWSPPAYA